MQSSMHRHSSKLIKKIKTPSIKNESSASLDNIRDRSPASNNRKKISNFSLTRDLSFSSKVKALPSHNMNVKESDSSIDTKAAEVIVEGKRIREIYVLSEHSLEDSLEEKSKSNTTSQQKSKKGKEQLSNVFSPAPI